MLSYNDMYNITGGIHTTFRKKEAQKRSLSINHGKAKREKTRDLFPVNKYSETTRENFILACLYVAFNKSPSSLNGFIGYLTDLNMKDVYSFKDHIINYRRYLKKDLEYLYNEDVDFDKIKKLYRDKKIMWYTYYFYVISSDISEEQILKSRIDGQLYSKIKKLILYVTFSEKSILKVREYLNKNIIK